MEPDGRRRTAGPWVADSAISQAVDTVLPLLIVMNIHLSRQHQRRDTERESVLVKNILDLVLVKRIRWATCARK